MLGSDGLKRGGGATGSIRALDPRATFTTWETVPPSATNWCKTVSTELSEATVRSSEPVDREPRRNGQAGG